MTQMSTMTETEESRTDQKVASFMAAFALSQLPRLAVSAGKFSAVRFRISSGYIPLFLNQMIISYRIAALLGTMVMNGLLLGSPTFKDRLNIVSSICTSLMSLCYAVTLVTFYTGGDEGYITAYYWGIVLTSFMYGCSVVSVTTLASSEIAGYLAAIPAASIVSSSYHLSFVKLGNKYRLQNINYWVVVWQIITAICLAVIAAGIWIPAYGSSQTNKSSTSNDDFWTGLSLSGSPLLLAAFGYGLQYAFYPAIAPYKLAGIQKGFYISLILLYTGAIPPAILLYLKEAKKGPGRKWDGVNILWHWSWLFFVLEVTCAYIFTIILHYPDGFIARTLRHSTVLLTLVIVLYDMCVHTTRGIGSNGASRQTTKNDGKSKNQQMATLNTLLYSIMQLVCAFMGNGYLKTYRQAEKDLDNWPTAHYGFLKSLGYWCGCSTKCACKNLLTAFTTDVRGSIVEKREFLYVVYADEVDNIRKPPKTKDPTVMKIVHGI
ncbi:hypothetical protein BEWA_001630 [Theileria equi strain WA]|uniref:Uncharacterized protein n=1 Tax=Theileria equi strain WA TaxID=1537102 RepID=L0B0G6_THEEQ|nr:hypothetical protein BEWA_001630 [Theileria equi strain WA]AFZ80756.1 hypothetical protein BEWA_001630 [Theileria equi strain WA]|eukprot:XP_004830422.1 hypothetical protein BEWA_001630 [Theileria equi strain WA]